MSKKINNNKGFSLVELIVVVAIMVVMTSALVLSISLIIGSEAKQACEKINAQLNEVKTGAMSRYSENFSVIYVNDPTAYEWADKEGYYVVKMMTTLAAIDEGEVQDPRYPEDDTKKITKFMPNKDTPQVIGVEHRYICNNRVSMDFTYNNGTADVPYPVIPDGTTGFTINYDRITGLYSNIETGTVWDDSNGAATGSEVTNSYPVQLDIRSGLRTYTIVFINETGKHRIDR